MIHEEEMRSERAGTLVPQKGGYAAFVPKPLPPQDLDLDESLLLLLSKADTALARLDGVTQVLPNPDLFVAMYIKKEALLSSQIEGTQASLRGEGWSSKPTCSRRKMSTRSVKSSTTSRRWGTGWKNLSSPSLPSIFSMKFIGS